ncbi:MAG: amidohydrolase [Bacteroidota bacterium]
MKISIIQLNLAWEDKTANFREIERLMSDVDPDTDIVILPEMFTTGFSMNPEKLFEEPLSETYRWLLNLAVKGKYGICGSYIVKEKGRFLNRWIMVTPEGRSWSYDKRHLFVMSGEEKSFSRGTERVTLKFRDAGICPNICYDLRFPVWSRNRNDYDLLINSANWPEARRDVWIALLKARAIENQCYVAGANRVGTDGTGIRYCGDSLIINPKGEIIGSTDKNKEGVITAVISMKELSDFRKKFPVLKDADDFKFTD